MTILDKIIAYKHKEVKAKKATFPISVLKQSALFLRETKSLAEALKTSSSGIIAEHKRRSPSKSVINDKVLITDVAQGYQNAGVSGMSILTDTNFFGGSLDDLLVARNVVEFPLLRKEFIVDAYQIYEAKAYGADAILLIAAALTESQLKEYSAIAKSLSLDVLLEVHNEEELNKSIIPTVDMLGVNNRNLKTFKVSIDISKELSSKIPTDFVKVSESGISSVDTINELKQYGFQGFLIGENFMKTENPGQSALKFIKQL
ncbi:indole-3-glycerol phosphate synthase [Patiriisocius marinistellae]|uniref:Indole-3-glycerol phosphate synthase n=1 Tax=Patiriisocius marinistellae TaxID=2494560 RepID=A0A5J4G3C7_9FLAO|nr:indole-3-glycerol phosphate synthase TrpC [Patiriisocius marinistellae]GEQ87275.1 indole-3-glycerol phosphate synthase [Patiriisocius marinistellae]